MSVTPKEKKKIAAKLWKEHQACEKSGDLPGAISKLQQAEAIFPGNAKVMAKRLRIEASVAEQASDIPGALAKLKEAKTHAPTNAKIDGRIAHLEATMMEWAGDLDGALKKLREAEALFPGNAKLKNQIARLQSELAPADDRAGGGAMPRKSSAANRAQMAIDQARAAQAAQDAQRKAQAAAAPSPAPSAFAGSPMAAGAGAAASPAAAPAATPPAAKSKKKSWWSRKKKEPTPAAAATPPPAQQQQQQRQQAAAPGAPAAAPAAAPVVPAKPMASWTPDANAAKCMCCMVTEFSFTTRKHHCRFCGIVIGKCCSQQALLPAEYKKNDPQRVCTTCFSKLAPQQEDLVDMMSNQNRENTLYKKHGKLVNSPVDNTLGHAIRKAAHTVENFFWASSPNAMVKDSGYAKTLLTNTKGVAFLTVVQAGFIGTGRFGSGCVVAKLEDGSWSAPSAIATIGGGIGGIGGDVTDVMLLLNTDRAVKTFSGAGGLQLGLGLSLAVGPVGRSAEAALNVGGGAAAPVFAYSQSKGIFAGAQAKIGVVIRRSKVNKKFYGHKVSSQDLLTGRVAPPPNAEPLYAALRAALHGGLAEGARSHAELKAEQAQRRVASKMWKEAMKLEKAGRVKEAIAKLKEAAALFPNNTAVTNRIATLEDALRRQEAEALRLQQEQLAASMSALEQQQSHLRDQDAKQRALAEEHAAARAALERHSSMREQHSGAIKESQGALSAQKQALQAQMAALSARQAELSSGGQGAGAADIMRRVEASGSASKQAHAATQQAHHASAMAAAHEAATREEQAAEARARLAGTPARQASAFSTPGSGRQAPWGKATPTSGARQAPWGGGATPAKATPSRQASWGTPNVNSAVAQQQAPPTVGWGAGTPSPKNQGRPPPQQAPPPVAQPVQARGTNPFAPSPAAAPAHQQQAGTLNAARLAHEEERTRLARERTALERERVAMQRQRMDNRNKRNSRGHGERLENAAVSGVGFGVGSAVAGSVVRTMLP